MNEIEIQFELNGEARRASVAPELLLADFLRHSLGLKGTKTSCEVEVCGACTVLLDGRPVSACATLTHEINGRSLVTIEGLGNDDALHPVQEAFWEEGGFECGFCTPGMILAARALLDENPDPSEEDIKTALDGNICRCTGYVSIIRSVRRAATLLGGKDAPAPRPADARRVDGAAKVRGEPVYTADLTHPGMLYARVLRSPHAHARIVGIDTSAAESHPGVVAVLTAADLKDISQYHGPLVKDTPVLAVDKVRYEGDAVAAVAAETLEAATAALELIGVEYEPLPALPTMDDALHPDALPLHEYVSEDSPSFPGYPGVDDEARKYANVSFHYERGKGDVDEGFAASERIFEHTFEFPKIAHFSMEPQLAVAEWREDGFTVWCSTQHPFIVQRELAEMFGVARERARVVVPLVGGTYGNKNHTKLEPVALALARKAGRRVFLHLSLEEESRTVSKPAMRVRLRTGVDRDGRLAGAGLPRARGRRRLLGLGSPGHPEGGLSGARPLPHPAPPLPRLHRVHQHGSGRSVPRHGHAPGGVGLRIADGHDRPGDGLGCRGVPAQEPPGQGRGVRPRGDPPGHRPEGGAPPRRQGDRLG